MLDGVNILGAAVAAILTFIIGGPWYSAALFGNIWQREAGDRRQKDKRHPGIVFVIAYLCALIATLTLSKFIGPRPELRYAVNCGFLVGLCFVAVSFGINYVFGGRSVKLWLIDAGYNVLLFTLFGLVLGIWPAQ